MEFRVEKVFDVIYICCFSGDFIEEEDERLLIIMFSVVFSIVKRSEVERIIKEKIKKVVEGDEDA